MTSSYIQQVADDLGIPDSELTLLDRAGVRTPEQLHSVLATFPSIAPGVAAGTSAWKPHLVLQSKNLQLNELFRKAVTSGAPPPQLPFGGRPPPIDAPSDDWPSGIVRGQRVGLVNTGPTKCWFPYWLAQDQGKLGTCVAYAAVACCEWLVQKAGVAQPALSEHLLYWEMKSHEPANLQASEADWLYSTLRPLSGTGLCSRQEFPFTDDPGKPWPPGAAPPAAVMNSISNRKFTKLRYYHNPGAGSAALLRRCLDDGPAAINLPVFQDKQSGDDSATNWTTPDGTMHGFVANPIEEVMQNIAQRAHLICVVGFVPDEDEPMGGYFIVKNSWGERWSIFWNGPETNGMLPNVGYGAITATYVEGYLCELLQLKLPDNGG